MSFFDFLSPEQERYQQLGQTEFVKPGTGAVATAQPSGYEQIGKTQFVIPGTGEKAEIAQFDKDMNNPASRAAALNDVQNQSFLSRMGNMAGAVANRIGAGFSGASHANQPVMQQQQGQANPYGDMHLDLLKKAYEELAKKKAQGAQNV